MCCIWQSQLWEREEGYREGEKRWVDLHGKEAGSANHPHTNLVGQPSTFTHSTSRKCKERERSGRDRAIQYSIPLCYAVQSIPQSVILKPRPLRENKRFLKLT